MSKEMIGYANNPYREPKLGDIVRSHIGARFKVNCIDIGEFSAMCISEYTIHKPYIKGKSYYLNPKYISLCEQLHMFLEVA